MLDLCDIADGGSDDDNNDGIPDECALPGDLDGDGSVGAFDLAILLGSWGPCADCDDCPADLDGDCAVGAADLASLLGIPSPAQSRPRPRPRPRHASCCAV